MKTLKILAAAAIIWFALASIHEGFVLKMYIEEFRKPTNLTTWPSAIPISNRHEVKKDDLFKVAPPEVRAPKDHPPLSFIVGGNKWTVHYTTDKALERRECSAYEDPNSHTIWLLNNPIRSNQRETFLHELLHVALWESRNLEPWPQVPYTEDENSFVEPMAPELLQAFRDNPEIVTWLTK